MKFQPGESGNPAGRPPGARNKKTIAMEEMFAATAQETAKFVIARAQCGDATAMRICMERTPPAFELPPVRCAADVQKAFDQVIDAFGRGAITMRAFPAMIAAVERMTRTAERIQALREGEDERYANQRVHGLHPSLIPKPTGEPDRYEALAAAIERGEDPFPDEPVKSAYVLAGEDLYSPVNSHPAPAAQETPATPAAEDTPAAVEPGAPPDDALYFPVNFEIATPEDETAEAATAIDAGESPSKTLAPSLPRERSERGEGGERSEPGGGTICSERASPPTPDPSPPRFAWGEGNPAAGANTPEEGDSLYFPVNSGAATEAEVAPGAQPAELAARLAIGATLEEQPEAA
jgi:hypothetical protein